MVASAIVKVYNYNCNYLRTYSNGEKYTRPGNILSLRAFLKNISTERFGSYEDIDQVSFFSSIPEDFVCLITGKLFQNPATLESGQTYEQVATNEWLEQGGKRYPVTMDIRYCGYTSSKFRVKMLN